jgi:hypothetical protein
MDSIWDAWVRLESLTYNCVAKTKWRLSDASEPKRAVAPRSMDDAYHGPGAEPRVTSSWTSASTAPGWHGKQK